MAAGYAELRRRDLQLLIKPGEHQDTDERGKAVQPELKQPLCDTARQIFFFSFVLRRSAAQK